MTELVKIELTGLSDKVREAVFEAKSPDSIVIAYELCANLSAEEVHEALLRGVRMMVEREARAQRAAALRALGPEPEQSERRRRNSNQRQRSRAAKQLEQITESHRQLIAEKFFSTWKETPTGQKFLGECTAEDLRYSAERHQERSAQALHRAAQDEALASRLADSGLATVRDLGYDEAAAAIHEAGG